MGARRMHLWLAALAGALALASLVIFGLASAGSPATRRAAPALPRARIAGAPTTLPSLLAGAGGRAVLVVFWASWCEPCAQEAPALERFYRTPSGRGRLVGVDWSDPLLGDARKFIRRYRWTFPILRDAEGTIGNEYGISGLPNTFVIDARGRIRETLRGPQSVSSLDRALAAGEGS